MSSSSDRVPSDLKSFLRSVLISSNGVKQSKVEKDYQDLAGEKLNWRKYGFKTLHEFLLAIPDVCRLEFHRKDKDYRVFAVEMKGIYMSTHALKNVKSAPTNLGALGTLKTENVQHGRTVSQEGQSLRITVDDGAGGSGHKDDLYPDMVPNNYGYYQVYVTRLPADTQKDELEQLFSQYGNVQQCDILLSSANRKIAFVRYGLKSEAVTALTKGKITPPVLHGQKLDLGLPKSKSTNNNLESSVRSVLNSDSSKDRTLPIPPLSPSSPLSLSSSPWTMPQCGYDHQQTSPSPQSRPAMVGGHDQQPTIPKHSTNTLPPSEQPTHSTLANLPPKPLPLDIPLFAVNISGYNNKAMNESNLKSTVASFGQIMEFEYHPMYTLVRFKTHREVEVVISGLNGKVINGCVLVVSDLKQNKTVEKQPTTTPKAEIQPVEEIVVNKTAEQGIQLPQIYDIHKDMIAHASSGPGYCNWLSGLSENFEIKCMDIIDPTHLWVHLHDSAASMHLQFNDLVKRLEYICAPKNGNQILINKNEFGVGKFSEDDKWYRCFCYELSSDLKNAHVVYIDYGNQEWLVRSDIVRLPPTFLQLPPQGVLVHIAGLSFNPTGNKISDSEAMLRATRLFLSGDIFHARKTIQDPDKPLLLELELIDSEGVYGELFTLPGIHEVGIRPSSPIEPVLLTIPPLPPNDLIALSSGLAPLKTMIFIWIVNITSPVTFHFQMASVKSREVITELRECLLKCDITNRVNVRNIKMDQLVCYHNKGCERSRVSLISPSGISVPGQVRVLHVDTGRKAMVSCTSFATLPRKIELDVIPYQARPALLYNVPDDELAQTEMIDFVVKHFKNQVLRTNVVRELRDGTVMVELYDARGESLNKQLIEIIRRSKEKHAQSQADEAEAETVQTIGQASSELTQPACEQNPATRGQAEEARGHSQFVRGQNPATREQAEEARGQADESRGQSQLAHGKNQATRGQAEEARGQADESLGQSQLAHGKNQATRGQAEEARGQADESRGQSQLARGKNQATRGQAEEARGQAEEVRRQAEESREKSQLAHGQNPATRGQAEGARGQSHLAREIGEDARVRHQSTRASPQDARAQTQDTPVQNQTARAQKHDTRRQIPDSHLQSPDARAQAHGPRAQTQDVRYQTQDARAQVQDSHAQVQGPRAQTQDVRYQAQDARAQVQDPRAQNEDPRAQVQDSRAQNQDPRAQNQDPRAQNQDPRAQNQDPRAQNQDPRTQNQDPRAQNQDPRAQNQDPRAQNQDPRAQTPSADKGSLSPPAPSLKAHQPQYEMAPSFSAQKLSPIRPSILSVDTTAPHGGKSSMTSPQPASKGNKMTSQGISPSNAQRETFVTSQDVPSSPPASQRNKATSQSAPPAPNSQGNRMTSQALISGSQGNTITSKGFPATPKSHGNETTSQSVAMAKSKGNGAIFKGNSRVERPFVLPTTGQMLLSVQSKNSRPEFSWDKNNDIKTELTHPTENSIPTNYNTSSGILELSNVVKGQRTGQASDEEADIVQKGSPTKEKTKSESLNKKHRVETRGKVHSPNPDSKSSTKRSPASSTSPRGGGFGLPGAGGAGKTPSITSALFVKPMDRNELVRNIAEQEKVLSKPASEQRQILTQKKMKEKLELQISIKTLENGILALEDDLKRAKEEKESLEKRIL